MRRSSNQQRSGIEVISWERFEQLTRILAEQIEGFEPQIILGVARGGLYPATMISFALRREFYPIRLPRRPHDGTAQDKVTWLVRPPEKVGGRRVIIVDEWVDSGQTLALAADEVRRLGASHVRTAALYAHTWAEPRPDYVALMSDALILNPWDREVLMGGHWTPHPELAAALKISPAEQPDPPDREEDLPA